MIGLKLRQEFLGSQMPGTAITLRTSDNQGAVQKSADQILSITYPTADIQIALKSLTQGRPIVLKGDRGRGKSHIMAVMHHAVQTPETVEKWLEDWSNNLKSQELIEFGLAKGYFPISEPVHNHEYPLLWNLLFERHPKGQYYKGQFEAMKDQYFPPRTLLEKMFAEHPTCLILDEFQTWYTGLPEKDPKNGFALKQWAYNFIQVLSEIAKDRPEILILVVSVINNQNDAFQQIHRQGPVLIDFMGPSAKQDRQKLLLHRLFENRRTITISDITKIAQAYAGERFRLLFSSSSDAEKSRIYNDVYECWPFSPELIELLEEHILMSQAAQETRDLIRILAQVFRSRGDCTTIITPADFFVDGETDEVQTFVDSIANQAGQEKLRTIAQMNLKTVQQLAGKEVPNARELISSIWMRSMSPGKISGGIPSDLHLDITKSQIIDDNSFQAELTTLIENSVNIHGDEIPGGPLRFSINENPRSKIRACAKNDKIWHVAAVSTSGQIVYPGKDIQHIRKTLSHILVSETQQPQSKVIVLGSNWKSDPWSEVEENDKPNKWDSPILLVIPEQIELSGEQINSCLGQWLVANVPKKRNTVRFLLLSKDAKGIFNDTDMIFSARCSYLCSKEGWGASDNNYKLLHQDFDRPFRSALKSKFNRFAILKNWDFQKPSNCIFEIEKINEQGDKIPEAVEKKILTDLFELTRFNEYIIQRSKDSDTMSSVFDDLSEPPPKTSEEAIPYIGTSKILEYVIDIAAKGGIVLNVSGNWIGRRPEDTTDDDARRYILSKAFRTGNEARQIQLGIPGVVGGGTVIFPVEKPGTTQPAPDAGSGGGNVTIPPAGGTNVIQPQPGGNTGGSTITDPPKPAIVSIVKKTEEPANGINLSGCFESWGISSDKTMNSIKIEFSNLSVPQIKQFLQRIPSNMKASLEISFDEEIKQ